MDWENLGNLAANVAKLSGLNAVCLVALIIEAASNARILKKRCREFAQHMDLIKGALEILVATELMEYHETREPLKKLEDVLRKSYVLVDSCQKRCYMTLLMAGCFIANKLKQAREEIDDCLKIMPLLCLVDNQRFKAAIKYSAQMGVDSCLEPYDMFNPYLRYSGDIDNQAIYIEAAAKTGQFEEWESVTGEWKFYDAEKTDAEKTKNFPMEVNPSNAALVVGQLLDDDCPEVFIKDLILSVRSLLPVGPLLEEFEKRNQLQHLTEFLQHLENEGSQDVHVHNALGKIIIDTNNDPKHFLATNCYYDSRLVGKYCEKRDPTLAVVAYARGQCDDELIDVARYVVKRMEPELWEKVLNLENPFRRQLIDQVVSTALPESKDPDQVSATLRAFMTANLQHELIELLEKILLQNSAFSGSCNLQKLLIITAIKADKSRVMDYINRLDKFDGPAIIKIAVKEELYEEAFDIAQKLNLNVQAVNVLLDSMGSIERAVEFASRVEEDAVWSQVAKAVTQGGVC